MAFAEQLHTWSAEAAADLSTYQYHCVKLNSSGKVAICGTLGERFIGILQNKPTAGEQAEIALPGGITKVLFGGTVDENDEIMTDASGHAIVATTGYYSGGVCVLGGAVTEIGSMLYCPHGDKATSPQSDVADAIIAVANATGAATGAALTAHLHDLAGANLAKTAVILILTGDTAYGFRTFNAHVTFGTATAGSILESGTGWCLAKCDATGAFACTATNASDETVYFVVTGSVGADAVANGIVIRGCVPDAATWSA
jgi:hypothetical protein